jgi:hypothetical protein
MSPWRQVGTCAVVAITDGRRVRRIVGLVGPIRAEFSFVGRLVYRRLYRLIPSSPSFKRWARSVTRSFGTSQEFEALGVRRLGQEDTRLKKSDKLFILGSASNINNLSDDQWREIRQNDSVGFNSWTRHKFVPSFYLAQVFTDDVIERYLSSDYSDCLLIFRGNGITRHGLDYPGLRRVLVSRNVENLRFMPELPVEGLFDDLTPREATALLRALGLWKHGSIPSVMPKFRVTVGLAVAFGFSMGYSTIVVCGFDPRKPGYFWDSDNASSRSAYYKSGLWAHESRWFMRNSVSKYLQSVDIELRRLGGQGVFLGSSSESDYGLHSYWSTSVK